MSCICAKYSVLRFYFTIHFSIVRIFFSYIWFYFLIETYFESLQTIIKEFKDFLNTYICARKKLCWTFKKIVFRWVLKSLHVIKTNIACINAQIIKTSKTWKKNPIRNQNSSLEYIWYSFEKIVHFGVVKSSLAIKTPSQICDIDDEHWRQSGINSAGARRGFSGILLENT